MIEGALSIVIEKNARTDPIIVIRLFETSKCFYIPIYRLYQNIIIRLINSKLKCILVKKNEISRQFMLNENTRVETVKCIVDKAHPVVCNRRFHKCCVCSYYIKLR